MSTRRSLFRSVNGMVLMVLMLGSQPAAAAKSAPPADTPPPQSVPAFRQPRSEAPPVSALAAVVEEQGADQAAKVGEPAAPAASESPDTCSAPAKVAFGQDLELLMGLMWNHSGYRVDQNPAWSGTGQMSQMGGETTATSGCTSSGPLPEQVYFYEDSNYGGGCYILTTGQYPSGSAMGVHNDHLSSVKVGSNARVTIFEDGNYGGGYATFDANVPAMSNTSIHNDHASSAKVFLVPHAVGNVAGTAWGTDRDLVLMKTLTSTTANGELAQLYWDGAVGWNGSPERKGLTADGNPIILNRGFDVSYFVRSGTRIKWAMSNAGVWSAWEDVPGITDAASDPVVVEPDIYHFKLFYRTSAGIVKFTEWESGIGWRATPLNLGSPSGTTLSSDLGAVARDETHVDVFGVSANNKLWVRSWSDSNNKSDWSDTAWVELASNIKVSKPGVASRAAYHIGVAALNTSNTVVYREWTYEAGWKALVTIGGYVEPVGLAATAGDEMFLYGVNASGNMYTNQWKSPGNWAGWVFQGSGWASGQSLAAIVARPHDLMLVGRNTSNEVVYKHYTNQGQALTATSAPIPNYGVLRGQAIATVNGRTVWVSGWRGTEGSWVIAARDTATWSGMHVFLDDPVPTYDTDKVSLTTADLDQDGSDEIILGSLSEAATRVQLSVYKLTTSGTTVTAITRKAVVGINYSSAVTKIQVAAGDLDADGKPEVALGVKWVAHDQAAIAAFEYTGYSLSRVAYRNIGLGVSSVQDFQMAVGQVDSLPGEQFVLSALGGYSYSMLTPVLTTVRYDPATASLGQVYSSQGLMGPGAVGPYASAIATGDVDSDGLDEVIYTAGSYIYATDLPSNSMWGALRTVGWQDANRSLAVGDVDADGRAEIVYSTDSGQGPSGGWMGIAKRVHPWINALTWYGTASVRGVPLLADLDGDSAIATFKRCDEVTDVHVLGVINSQPVWYQNGTSIQNSGGGMANSSTASTGSADGWKTTFGTSIKVGFEHEFEVPLLAIKVGEVRASVTAEFEGSVGGSTEHESSTTETEGVSYGSQAFGLGAVCYTQTSYKCYKYELSKPGTTVTSTAQSCVPVPNVGGAPQVCSALEDWHSTSFKQAAGNSWAPVGHRPPNTTTMSVDLGWANNYPVRTSPPVDPYRVWWVKKTPFDVYGSLNPASVTQDWSVGTTVATKTISTGSFEANLEVSAGFTAGDVTFDASVKAGAGGEWSSSVGWETGIEFNGHVYHYPSSCTSPCQRYSIIPYIYKAQAKTLTGATYNYLEQDYYVTRIGWLERDDTEAAPQSILGIVPQAPVVTSSTHTDPATWYPTNTVVLEWGQPAGDPAVVTSYRWNLSRSPVVTPTALGELTTTHTYLDLADGVYYLHIQAVGDGGDFGPVTHRAIRVDMTAPQVTLITDPFVPDGFDGWYKTPVTVSLAATDTIGSGVATVETSVDGTTWLPYSAPIPIAANTSGATLWARATDTVGHTSDPISATIKLDKTAPTTVDSDGFGLSYASILTDEVGNAQLVLGGALSDTLSGRLQVEVKAGDTGQWNAVSAVGDLPIPPGNQFSTTMTSLNWIYTPSFEIRGVYPLWGRGVDAAGNTEPAWVHGAFWWEPDDVPVLAETRVSVSPHQANPGDVVAFTVAARNVGYQEAQMRITDTVPAGLTVVTETIDNGGQYDANTREIVWTLHALWPGQTRYLFFQTTAESVTEPVTLTNQVDMMGYWPWEALPGVPPEPARHYYSTTATLTVLPSVAVRADAAATMSSASRILDAAVVEGEIVANPQVTLLVNATPEVRFLYVKEWVWDNALSRWSLARESGWVPFETAEDFEVSQDSAGKYGRYQWMLSEGDGVKYIGLWVADAAGQTSNVNEGNLIYTNLISAGGQQLPAGQVVQYRVKMRAEQLAILSLVSLSGDADLFVWKPRAGFMPHYYSNAIPPVQGLSLDTVGFFAPEEGMYVVEVQAATDAYYRLITAGGIAGTGALADTQANPALAQLSTADMAALKAQDEALREAHQALPASTHLALADKVRPAHPFSLSTPYSLSEIDQLPGQPDSVFVLYLPLAYR